ncbi:MAG: hypothetical protein J2O49_04945 [Sciscionella sp.]|nr:hypothetical protein [Sciscionella sp.]
MLVTTCGENPFTCNCSQFGVFGNGDSLAEPDPLDPLDPLTPLDPLASVEPLDPVEAEVEAEVEVEVEGALDVVGAPAAVLGKASTPHNTRARLAAAAAKDELAR